MRVSKCSEAASEPALKELSYEEMCKEEGVYRRADNEESSSRLVVLVCTSSTVVLYHSNGMLEPADWSWRTCRFVKVDAEVCFEIKEKRA